MGTELGAKGRGGEGGEGRGRRELWFFIRKLDGTTLRKEELLRCVCDIVEKVMFHFRLRQE